MGNIGSQSSQISGNNRDGGLHADLSAAKRYIAPELWENSSTRTVKVLPELESNHSILRHTNNGKILHSGGTLSGRHETRLRNVHSSPYAPMQIYSFHKTGLESNLYKADGSGQKGLDHHLKLCRSEPDLQIPSLAIGQERQKKKYMNKKKYKAPPPPTSSAVQGKQSAYWDESRRDESYPLRRNRLFKTRSQTKKECGQTNKIFERSGIENNNSDIFEERIQESRQYVNCLRPQSLPEFSFNESNGFKMDLIETNDIPRSIQVDVIKSDELFIPSRNNIQTKLLSNSDFLTEKGCPRSEPSGKESLTPETSSLLGAINTQKPRSFYFGMDREDSDTSSSYPVENDEETSTIALRLRPILPRKLPRIPQFSPTTAWRLLDTRSQDSGISWDARSPLPSSWTPQQDLGDDSSIDDAVRDEPRAVTKQRPHVFSLSSPCDHQPVSVLAMTVNKNCINSLGRLKKSVSGVLNTLSIKKEQEQRASSREDDANWFFTRSAPNSLNENSLELLQTYYPQNSSTSRLMYLPETNIQLSPVKNEHPLSLFSKSCEELQVTEPLRNIKTILNIPWLKEERQKKPKKFTFQSTLRQIERKIMADKLSREAEKTEKQRLGELEAMRQVEEEFQKKRAKEKANLRQQLRLYSMGNNKWTSLSFNIHAKTEERQPPDGALSFSDSSLSLSKSEKELRNNKHFEDSIMAHVTKESSKYGHIMQREYNRESAKYAEGKKQFRQTTVHPEITYDMPNAKGNIFESGNYRKDYVCMENTKLIIDNESEHSQHNYSPKMYRNKFSPVTRF